tara:strand:+ start:949 stop:1617 length:669 start_codon:yes stop_codon:yes gene_type:complete
MKLTRRQLRRLIISEIRIKPGGDMDPEFSEKLTGMVDTGDEAFITQADELAPMLGYEGDSFSKDLETYDQVSIMGAVGEFAHYLTDEDKRMLMDIADKDLKYWLHSFYGFAFAIIPFGTGGINAEKMNDMIIRIAAKKKDITDNDYAEHEGMDTMVEALHTLSIAIMKLSNKTHIDESLLDDAGIGRKRGPGDYDFYRPEYEQLYNDGKDDGKLVITPVMKR